MDKFKFQTVDYKARNLNKAHKAFQKDVPYWMSQGYILHSRTWGMEKRGCFMWLFWGRPMGHLLVTYELVRVAQPDTANNASGVGQAY